MTNDRITTLRRVASDNIDGELTAYVIECLDEIERLGTENKQLVHALTDFRYSHDEIELSCGVERAMEVREKVMFRRAIIDKANEST